MQSLSMLLLLGTAACHSFVPLVAWSPDAYLTGSCTLDVPDVVQAAEVTGMMQNLNAQKDVTSKFVATSAKQPEVVLALIAAEMSSSTALRQAGAFGGVQSSTFAFVKESLKAAKSCLSVPYLQSDATTKVLTDAAVTTVKLGASGVSCTSLMAELATHAAEFTNGKTELFTLNTEGVDATCLTQLVADVSARTKGSFVALFTAEKSDVAEMILSKPTALIVENEARQLLSVQPLNTGLLYVNAPILSGLFLAFMMLFFVWVGVSCLMSIQAPARFATVPLPVPKEY